MEKFAIGEKIKILRKNKGLTQFQLAELVEMHEKHISRIGNNKYIPTVDNLFKILSVLEADLTNIFSVSQPKFSGNPIKLKLIKLINSASDKELSTYLAIIETLKTCLKKYNA